VVCSCIHGYFNIKFIVNETNNRYNQPETRDMHTWMVLRGSTCHHPAPGGSLSHAGTGSSGILGSRRNHPGWHAVRGGSRTTSHGFCPPHKPKVTGVTVFETCKDVFFVLFAR